MATATKQARATRQVERRTVDGAPSQFRVFQSNSGDYRWEIVSENGATLAQSGSFASLDDAERAASRIRDGAASARLERRGPDARPLVVA